MCTHLWAIKSLDFELARRPNRRDHVADLEPNVRHAEPKDGNDRRIDKLGPELARVTVDDSTDAIRAGLFDPFVANDAVPTCTILAGGEDANRDDAPQAV